MTRIIANLSASTADPSSNISSTLSGSSIYSLSALDDGSDVFLPNIALNTWPFPCFLCTCGIKLVFSGAKISTTIQVVSSRSPDAWIASW